MLLLSALYQPNHFLIGNRLVNGNDVRVATFKGEGEREGKRDREKKDTGVISFSSVRKAIIYHRAPLFTHSHVPMNYLNNYMNGYMTNVNNVVNNGTNTVNNHSFLQTLRGGPAATHNDVQSPQAPLGIYTAFSQHEESITLHIREQSNSKHTDEYAIVDMTNNSVIFQIRGESRASLRSLTHKKEMFDRNGNHLYTIRRKGLSLFHGTFEGVEPRSGRVVFEVTSKVGRSNSMVIAFLNTANRGEHITLHLGEDMYHHAAKITLANGIPIAQIARDEATHRQMLCEFDRLPHHYGCSSADSLL